MPKNIQQFKSWNSDPKSDLKALDRENVTEWRWGMEEGLGKQPTAREAQRAVVHGVAESDTTERLDWTELGEHGAGDNTQVTVEKYDF